MPLRGGKSTSSNFRTTGSKAAREGFNLFVAQGRCFIFSISSAYTPVTNLNKHALLAGVVRAVDSVYQIPSSNHIIEALKTALALAGCVFPSMVHQNQKILHFIKQETLFIPVKQGGSAFTRKIYSTYLEVTRLLLFTAQASHDEVPPDVMEPVLRTIADNFVTERASSEAIAVGLNAVREICARCPYGISQDLLSDLVQYRTYKNKNVVASARSLIRLYREINPSALPRKERGRPTEAQMETMIEGQTFSGLALSFGQTTAAKFVPGAEALVLAETLAKQSKREDRNNSGSSKRMVKDDKETKNTEERQNAEGVDADANDEDSEACDGEGSWESCSDSDDSESDNDCDDEDAKDLEGPEDTKQDATAIPRVDKSLQNVQKKDDGWIDVPQSSDDDEAEVSDTAKPKIDPSELASKALEIASSRIFTQEEFEAMRRYQLNKQKRFAAMGSRNKRKAEDDSEFLEIESEEDEADGDKGNNQLVTMSAITRLVKRPRQSKAERLEAIEEGRTGREKYGYKVNRMNPHASTTNREKSKGKTFQMIKHKVRQKAKRSFRDKQVALRDQLRHMLKHMR
ncbi:SDA1 protein [Opisthorchis viverrini]|uniref:Protein SDA1 n=1 Tax=Opisthorchis viverrini TaxID=6198 RepID=A0A1S8X611_OPIVI|nr:SDA1 protein [Opisthorchis viverrini]